MQKTVYEGVVRLTSDGKVLKRTETADEATAYAELANSRAKTLGLDARYFAAAEHFESADK